MISFSFAIGLLGSIVLVIGAGWPELKDIKHPTHSVKNWLLAIGGLLMLTYATLNYLTSGSIFFVFLQVLVGIASIMMMLNTNDKTVTIVMVACGLGLIVWSLFLFENYNTIFFVLGLTGIGLGYALKPLTVRRMLALTLGSVLIALFSYIEKNWIFFWLNIFFAVFSGYYLFLRITKKNGGE